MSGLNAFLRQNAKKPENVKFAVSERFTDEKGNLLLWEIRPLTSGEDENMRREYTRLARIPGKNGQYRQDFDSNGYLTEMVAQATVFPNLNDKELQDSYGVMGAVELLKAMLTAGEAARYMQKVQEVNGFISQEDLVEQAKN